MRLGQEERRVCAGETYGLLTAVEPDPEKHKSPQWLCRCQCGAMTSVQERHLLSGHTKSCGCLTRRAGARRALDLTGQRFGRLTALEPTGERRRTSVLWRCRCDCGKEVECETEDLTRGKVRSCGCLQEDQRKINMAKAIHFVDGTCVERIASTRPGAANTSGRRGVSRRKNGTWRACIGFQGKRYDLGTYPTFEEAVKAREKGEKMYQEFLEDYYAGQQTPRLRE